MKVGFEWRITYYLLLIVGLFVVPMMAWYLSQYYVVLVNGVVVTHFLINVYTFLQFVIWLLLIKDYEVGKKLLKKKFLDYEERLELAKLIGLEDVPDLDPNAINELSGIFDDVSLENIDAVELIREVRLRDWYKYYEVE